MIEIGDEANQSEASKLLNLFKFFLKLVKVPNNIPYIPEDITSLLSFLEDKIKEKQNVDLTTIGCMLR